MDYGLRKMNAGIQGALGTIGNLGKIRADAFDSALNTGASGRLKLMKARKAHLQNEALLNLENTLGDIMAAQGIDNVTPGYTASLANLMRAGQGNFEQLSGGLGNMADIYRQAQAIDTHAANPDLANVMLHASGRKAYEPFAMNAKGAVLNKATGGVGLGNAMARASIASTNRANSGRGGGGGSIGAANARKFALVEELVQRGYSKEDAMYMAGFKMPSQGGGVKPTSAIKNYQFLLNEGVPEPEARARAFAGDEQPGPIKWQNPITGEAAYIDPQTNEVIRRVTPKGEVLVPAPTVDGAAQVAPNLRQGAAAAPAPQASGEPKPMISQPTQDDPLGIRHLKRQ